MSNVKLSQITSGGSVESSTDTLVAVRSGTTDVLVSVGDSAVENLGNNIIDDGAGNLVVSNGGITNIMLQHSAITIGAQTGLAGGGSVALGSAITLSMGIGTANTLAGYNNSGVFGDVSIGSNLSLSGGILNGTVGPAPVSSVFSRTGAVAANWNDYQFNLIGGTASVSQGGTGLQTLTAHAVMLGEGVSAVSFATVGTSGRLLTDQGSGDDPIFTSLTTSQLPINQTTREITFSLDGQGSAISAISGSNTWYLANTPFAGTITRWSLVADKSGSIDIDVWKANAAVPTIANTITASAQCSLASSQSMFAGPITGWSSAVSQGDCWGFNLVSASTLTKANLTIQIIAS